MNNKKEKIALNSVGASLFLTLLKLIVGISTGSIGIISEAIHSGLDFAAAFITYVSVKISGRPSDISHHYGYGKVESISALIETFLLLLTSIWIVYEAVNRLIFKSIEVQAAWYAFLVMIISVIVDISRSRALYKVARETNSLALEADALHFKSDIYNSLVVLAGLVFISFGVKMADSLAAIGVSILVLHAAFQLGKRTVYVLMDRAPDGLTEKINAILKSIPEVSAIDRIRVRSTGPSFHIELSLGISRTIPLEQTHKITEVIEEEIKKSVNGADVLVHVRPVALLDENVIERIQIIAANDGFPVHNIKVYTQKNKRFVDLDLEVSDKLSLDKAHGISSAIENSLKLELGHKTSVNVHIEPVKFGEMSCRETDPKDVNLIHNEIDLIKKNNSKIQDIHKVVMHNVDDKIYVSLHCLINKKTSLEEAHKLSEEIENKIKQVSLRIEKIIVHTEPIKR